MDKKTKRTHQNFFSHVYGVFRSSCEEQKKTGSVHTLFSLSHQIVYASKPNGKIPSVYCFKYISCLTQFEFVFTTSQNGNDYFKQFENKN